MEERVGHGLLEPPELRLDGALGAFPDLGDASLLVERREKWR
jgi:hypothetical protein